MAIAIIAEVPGRDAQFDDQVTQALDMRANPPAGSLARFAGPVPGGWRVISIWESQEAFDKFRTERLEPALRAAGQEPPQFQASPLHSVQINR